VGGPAPNKKIEIQVGLAQMQILQRIFDRFDVNTDEVAAQIAQIAFDEWVDWMSGERRFSSDTDQSIDRVINIYAQVMPSIEPEVGVLYNRFNIPYGRARYIIQAITNRQLRSLNQQAQERLVATLQAELNELNRMNPNDRKLLQEVRFVVDPRAEKLLMSIIDQMPLEKRPISSFKRLPTFLPTTREYSLPPRDIEPVLEAVRNFML
jgi:hypothetical protein